MSTEDHRGFALIFPEIVAFWPLQFVVCRMVEMENPLFRRGSQRMNCLRHRARVRLSLCRPARIHLWA